MRKIFLSIVFCISYLCLYSQVTPIPRMPMPNQDAPFPFRKNGFYNEPGSRMKEVGKFFTITGGVLIGVGVYKIAAADKAKVYYTQTNGTQGFYYKGSNDIELGVLSILIGLASVTPGVIFWSIGSKRYNKYQNMQEFSLNLSGAGLGLKLKI